MPLSAALRAVSAPQPCVKMAIEGGEVEWSAPVFIDAVDVGSIHEQGLNHLDLTRELVEHRVMEWRATSVVWHVDKVSRVSSEDSEDFLGRALRG